MTTRFDSCADLGEISEVLDSMPTISPDEVRGVGKWEMWEDYYGSNVYKCSVCGSDWDMIEGTPQDNDFKYCPNCGARMTEVSEDA